jgi:DNA repair photolyase
MHVLDSFDIPRYLPRMTQMPASGRGRAARSNDAGRYSTFARAEFDDGWSGTDEAAKRQIRTTVTSEKVRTILSRNDSPDLRFNVTLNPYRGCEHGCIYCFARPNHAYVGLSPGLDFETRLFAKPDAARVLERELSKPGYDPQRLQVGASTDAYQPIEKELRITRQVLEVLERFHHPVAITTKSALILRDTDILARMARKELVFVIVAITTLDRRLARAMEPRAGSPPRRIATIEALSAAGVPVAVGLSPMIPGLTDHEMDAILEAAAGAGALLHPPASSARDQGPVPRVATSGTPRECWKDHLPHPPDARRARLRFTVRQAHDRRGPGGGDDAGALSPSLPPPRPRPAGARPAHRSFLPTAQTRRSAVVVLTSRGEPAHSTAEHEFRPGWICAALFL